MKTSGDFACWHSLDLIFKNTLEMDASSLLVFIHGECIVCRLFDHVGWLMLAKQPHIDLVDELNQVIRYGPGLGVWVFFPF